MNGHVLAAEQLFHPKGKAPSIFTIELHNGQRKALPPKDSAPLYVEITGGSKKILEKGKKLYKKGKHSHAMEVLNKLAYAESDNAAAKDLLADVFEQIGYQQESPSVRNSFLAAAFEPRSGIPKMPATSSSGPGTIRALSTELWLDFLSIRLDSKKAEGKQFKIKNPSPVYYPSIFLPGTYELPSGKRPSAIPVQRREENQGIRRA